jgi:hypothetical protein
MGQEFVKPGNAPPWVGEIVLRAASKVFSSSAHIDAHTELPYFMNPVGCQKGYENAAPLPRGVCTFAVWGLAPLHPSPTAHAALSSLPFSAPAPRRCWQRARCGRASTPPVVPLRLPAASKTQSLPP